MPGRLAEIAVKLLASGPTTWRPPVYHWLRPRSSVPVPSVAMKELILNRVTSVPFTKPTAAPMSTTRRTARGQGRPCWVCRPLASTWAMPSTEAAERSNWLAASGIITASATRALIERLLASERKVKALRKVSGFRTAKRTIRMISRIRRCQTERRRSRPDLEKSPLMPRALRRSRRWRRRSARSAAAP